MYPDPAGPQVGDPILNFLLPNTKGDMYAARSPGIAGERTAILLLGAPADARTVSELDACREQAQAYRDLGCPLVVICTAAAADLPAETDFMLLADQKAEVAAGFGIGGKSGRRLPMAFLVDPASRVQAVIEASNASPLAALALAELRHEPPHAAGLIIGQVAPVLMLPRVLEPAFCDQLMELWSTSKQQRTGVARPGETTSHTDFGANYKSRIDHQITDPAWIDQVQRRLTLRVLPEIEKVHFYKATRFEFLRIGCYDAADGGHFGAHRDNTTQAGLHRRFALTLCLNEDYEGGSLGFPEYGSHLYRPGKGEAIVFSCSLLHRVTPVTAGRRYVLITFFFGEAEYQARQAAKKAYRETAGGPSS